MEQQRPGRRSTKVAFLEDLARSEAKKRKRVPWIGELVAEVVADYMMMTDAERRRRDQKLADSFHVAVRLKGGVIKFIYRKTGETTVQMAKRAGLSRQTIYNWIKRGKAFIRCSDFGPLCDRKRTGRPRISITLELSVLAEEKPPGTWTIPLTAKEIMSELKDGGIDASESSIRRRLKEMGFLWCGTAYRKTSNGRDGLDEDEALYRQLFGMTWGAKERRALRLGGLFKAGKV